MKKILLLFSLFLLWVSCQNDYDNPENSVIPEETCDMQFDDLGLTEANAIITLGTNSIGEVIEADWTVKYSENTVELSYEDLCGDECIGNYVYVFKKINDCIKYDYSYFVNTIFQGRVWTSIYETYLEHDFIIQEYIPDEKLVGRLVTNYSGNVQNLDFWIDFTTNDFIVEDVPDYNSFLNCLGNQLPLSIDINNDGNNDFNFTFTEELIESTSSTNWIPVLSSMVKIETLNNNNYILAGIRYSELPISSEDLTTGIISSRFVTYADFIYENNYPYKQYNFWTSIYGEEPFFESNLTDFYYAVKMTINGEPHYGYINFSILGNDCEIIIHETYLNPTPNEHIVIE